MLTLVTSSYNFHPGYFSMEKIETQRIPEKRQPEAAKAEEKWREREREKQFHSGSQAKFKFDQMRHSHLTQVTRSTWLFHVELLLPFLFHPKSHEEYVHPRNFGFLQECLCLSPSLWDTVFPLALWCIRPSRGYKTSLTVNSNTELHKREKETGTQHMPNVPLSLSLSLSRSLSHSESAIFACGCRMKPFGGSSLRHRLVLLHSGVPCSLYVSSSSAFGNFNIKQGKLATRQQPQLYHANSSPGKYWYLTQTNARRIVFYFFFISFSLSLISFLTSLLAKCTCLSQGHEDEDDKKKNDAADDDKKRNNLNNFLLK